MSREKGCALFLVFAVTMAVAPSATAQQPDDQQQTKKKKKKTPALTPGPDSPATAAAPSKRKNKASAALLTAGGGTDSIERGDKFYERKDYFMASIEYNKAIEEPGSDEVSKQTAEFKMGKTLYKLHFYSTAISYFDRIVQKGASHPNYNETLQWLAALTRDVPDSAGVLEKIGKYDWAELENPQLTTVRDELYFSSWQVQLRQEQVQGGGGFVQCGESEEPLLRSS